MECDPWKDVAVGRRVAQLDGLFRTWFVAAAVVEMECCGVVTNWRGVSWSCKCVLLVCW